MHCESFYNCFAYDKVASVKMSPLNHPEATMIDKPNIFKQNKCGRLNIALQPEDHTLYCILSNLMLSLASG